MASNSNTGFWFAIVILGFTSIGAGAMYFNQQTDLEEAQQLLVTIEVNKLASEHKNESANDYIDREVKFKTDIEDLEEALAEKDKLIGTQKNEIIQGEVRLKTREEEAKNLKDTNAKIRETHKAQRTELTSKIGQEDKELKTALANLERDFRDVKSKSKRLSREKTLLEERTQTIIAASSQSVRALESENDGLRKATQAKDKATVSRNAVQGEVFDGKIIQIDMKNRFAVVDLGRSNNIHRGMRFKVIRRRLNRWDDMGELEVTKVGTTTSTATLLEKTHSEKKCDKCGYKAKTPEEMNCPFCKTGESHDRVVSLIRTVSAKDVSISDTFDPILVGDYIANPFYNKKDRLRFIIAGETVIYSKNIIEAQIKDYGGIIDNEITVETDYLILGRVPDETKAAFSDEAKKRLEAYKKVKDVASQYGIPIMREVELFNYLRN